MRADTKEWNFCLCSIFNHHRLLYTLDSAKATGTFMHIDAIAVALDSHVEYAMCIHIWLLTLLKHIRYHVLIRSLLYTIQYTYPTKWHYVITHKQNVLDWNSNSQSNCINRLEWLCMQFVVLTINSKFSHMLTQYPFTRICMWMCVCVRASWSAFNAKKASK